MDAYALHDAHPNPDQQADLAVAAPNTLFITKKNLSEKVPKTIAGLLRRRTCLQSLETNRSFLATIALLVHRVRGMNSVLRIPTAGSHPLGRTRMGEGSIEMMKPRPEVVTIEVNGKKLACICSLAMLRHHRACCERYERRSLGG